MLRTTLLTENEGMALWNCLVAIYGHPMLTIYGS